MKIVILGASGLVGRTILEILEKADWVTRPPSLLASARSSGQEQVFRGQALPIHEVQAEAFQGADIALFSAGGTTSRRWGPVAAEKGCLVVDNSSAFRMTEGIPLVVPEINGQLLSRLTGGGIVANPNCSTIQIALALAPLEALTPIQEVQVTTLQAVSGGGQKAVTELARQAAGGDPALDTGVFPRPIAANAIPAIGLPQPDGSFEEEAKVERELRKILGRDSDLAVTCTATRVPVVNGHSAALRAVCSHPVDLQALGQAMARWPGLAVQLEPHAYATAREISGQTEVHVGRLRLDPNNSRAVLMWVVADNLLKGAAWNAVQIAERYAENRAS